jgi:uncharacterized protein YutE (UPF0331/DUF86 family)
MVGFRNIAIDEYEDIDVDVLKAILQHHLSGIEALYTAIIRYYGVSK